MFSDYDLFELGIETNNKYNINYKHHLKYSNFNQPLLLSHNLTHLTFGDKFNQIVSLPSKLKFLSLSSNNLHLIENLSNGN